MCEWTGVECTGSRVVEIKAEFFLTGDVALLAGVTRLEEIDLEKALVFGSIEVKNAPQTRLVHRWSRRHWLSVWQALAVLQHLEELELERAAVHGAIEVTNHSRPVLFFCAESSAFSPWPSRIVACGVAGRIGG